jgi:hypothetical protein
MNNVAWYFFFPIENRSFLGLIQIKFFYIDLSWSWTLVNMPKQYTAFKLMFLGEKICLLIKKKYLKWLMRHGEFKKFFFLSKIE